MSNDNDFINQHVMIIGVGAPAKVTNEQLFDAYLARSGTKLPKGCTGELYAVNPDAPEEGLDIRHAIGCKMHGIVRPLHVIARDIRRDWRPVWFGAVPYLEAMSQLDNVNDMYGCDRARDIVNYFLSNAQTWKGDVARRIKVELKGMVGR